MSKLYRTIRKTDNLSINQYNTPNLPRTFYIECDGRKISDAFGRQVDAQAVIDAAE